MPDRVTFPRLSSTKLSIRGSLQIGAGMLLLLGTETAAGAEWQAGGAAAVSNETSQPSEPQATTIHPRQALLLGYNLGVASVQAAAAMGNPADTASRSAKNFASVSLLQADEIARSINSYSLGQGGYTFSTDGGWIATTIGAPNVSATDISSLYNHIVVLRESHTAVFAKIAPRLTNLYVLGVNVGIAEAQATQGEAARLLVEAALVIASEKATAVGLPNEPVENVLSALRRGAALSEVHTMILSARSTYTNSL